jgi:hypothetical protein
MPEKCSFKVLRDIVTKRFPSLKAVLIKYKDSDGDLVTITDTQVLRMAESCLDQPVQMEAEKEENGLSLTRLHIVEVNLEQEPTITEEETEAPRSEIGTPESDEKHVQMETETKVESKKKVKKTNVSVQEMVYGALPAEEAKTSKKEKEKEKQLKKMLEGKLLTGKQKEEQRKLEAMRWQFITQSAEGLGSKSSGTTEVKERPKYETKKQKPNVVEKEVIEEVMKANNEVEESTVDDESAESQSQIAAIEEAKEQTEEVKSTWKDDNWDTKIWNDDSEKEDDVEAWSNQF